MTSPLKLDHRDQIDKVLRLLEDRKFSRESPVFTRSLEWLQFITTELNDPDLYDKLVGVTCHAFDIKKADLYIQVAGARAVNLTQGRTSGVIDTDTELASLLPTGGWFEQYADFTRQTEAPLSYHIFSSLCVLGCALGRRVFVKMGFFNIYPNISAVLIGPTGRVKKTSATDIAKDLIRRAALCPVMADAITPEALASTLGKEGGHQFVYAPEFSVLFNRQKYNEKLVVMIIRLLDCPETFEVETLARGKETVINVALTILGCSTFSLFTGATPEMVTSSGFLNRFMLIVEEDTNREFAVPQRGATMLEERLTQRIQYVKKLSGEVGLSPEALHGFFEPWYHERRKILREVHSELAAEIMERGAGHLLRLAMLTHIVEHGSETICVECARRAARLLEFVEKKIPLIVSTIQASSSTVGSEGILTLINRMGGAADHSSLLRRSRLDAMSFRRVIETLVQQRRVRVDRRGAMSVYILQEVDDAHS